MDDAYDKFLVAIKDCGGPARKIRRAYAVAATEAVVLLPEHRSPPPSTRPLALRLPPPPASAPARWPTHLRRDLAAADGPRAQGAVEEKERERWVAQVAAILRVSGLPSARLAEEALDPEAFLRRCAGGRRVRTLRLRVRPWQRWRRGSPQPARAASHGAIRALSSWSPTWTRGPRSLALGRFLPRS